MHLNLLYPLFASVGLVILAQAPVQADETDFGQWAQHQLQTHSESLFGIKKPVPESAYGPYTGADNLKSVQVAKGLKVSVVSNVTHTQSDMIALWPNDENPTHAFVCAEVFFSGNNPNQASVQRVNLNGDPNNNVEVIVKGISSCDPIQRTPWGSLLVGEESGADGGFYEIMDPMQIDAVHPAIISDRSVGTSSDPRVVKRKAIGAASKEGVVVLESGIVYFGDELRPSKGLAGGAIYKFMPDSPYHPMMGIITDPNQSPLRSGSNYGMRLGTRNNQDYGQGSETGVGNWVAINSASYVDAQGNINLSNAQKALSLTGYYRPEDMDRDPLAMAKGEVRMCWANTGRMSSGLGSAIEVGANYGEVMCLEDRANSAANTGAMPQVTRLVMGDKDANHFDNVAFQPHSGRLVVLEDGETQVVDATGNTIGWRGNDIWMCLSDGHDRDEQSDGCIRIASISDTDAESTGFIFDASGENAYFNVQHRSTGKGAMLKLSGFKIK